jgi:APA family basic amino acid/polyamine antiporter
VGSAGSHRHVGSYRTITVIAAVSYGELSAMFQKQVDNIFIRRHMENSLVFYGWSFFAVIQTGTIAAVGVAFAKFTAYLFPIVSDKNILYEIGDFNLNAGCFHFHHRFTQLY